MLQRNSLILWKHAETRDFQTYTKEAYETMQVLISYGICIPAYETVMRKKDAKLFEWNYNNFCSAVRKNAHKEGNLIFNELGYVISFFSSLNNKESSGITMSLGNTNSKFINALVIDFSPSIDLYNKNTAMLVSDMFCECVNIIKPFWGCISNGINMKNYKFYLKDNKPTTVHWINYWSDEIVNKIGKKKIQNVLKAYKYCSLENGLFKIKDIALDINSEEDIIKQSVINKELGLKT